MKKTIKFPKGCSKAIINNTENLFRYFYIEKDFSCFTLAKFYQDDFIVLQENYIRKNDAFSCLAFARWVKNANISRLQQVVINSGQSNICFEFAKTVVGADVRALEKVAIYNNDLDVCLKFAKEVKNANIIAHQKVMIESKNPKYCLYFAQQIKGANIKELESVIEKSGVLIYQVKFDKLVNNLDPISLIKKYSKNEKTCEAFKKLPVEEYFDSIYELKKCPSEMFEENSKNMQIIKKLVEQYWDEKFNKLLNNKILFECDFKSEEQTFLKIIKQKRKQLFLIDKSKKISQNSVKFNFSVNSFLK